MNTYCFDDRKIQWHSLDGIEHLHYSILDVDEKNHIVDVLFKLEAGQQIVLHRHKAANHMLVLQGEHRLYHANGEIMDIRPTSRYTVSLPSEEPHREGGGAGQDAIILFSIRGSDGVFYEILDDNLAVTARLGLQDFIALFQIQQNNPV